MQSLETFSGITINEVPVGTSFPHDGGEEFVVDDNHVVQSGRNVLNVSPRVFARIKECFGEKETVQ